MAKTALLLMDLQNAIIERLANGDAYLNRIHKVVTAARRAGVPIVYVVVKFRRGFPEVSPKNKAFAMLKAGAISLQEGDSGAEIAAILAPHENETVVTKKRVGAFSGSDLDVVLRSQEIDHIVLAGLATSGVILSTVRAAADLDYQITVLADCCGDRDEEVHRVLMEKVFPNQAEVVPATTWLMRVTKTN